MEPFADFNYYWNNRPHQGRGPSRGVPPCRPGRNDIGSLRKTVISRRNLWHIHLLPKRSHALFRSSHRWFPSPVLAKVAVNFRGCRVGGSRGCPPPPVGKRTKGSTDDRESPQYDRKAGSPDRRRAPFKSADDGA